MEYIVLITFSHSCLHQPNFLCMALIYQEFYLNDTTVLWQHRFEHANTYTAIITMTTDTTMITIKEIHDESPDSSTAIDK